MKGFRENLQKRKKDNGDRETDRTEGRNQPSTAFHDLAEKNKEPFITVQLGLTQMNACMWLGNEGKSITYEGWNK